MSTANFSKVKIGELLISQGLINIEQLESALESQKETGRKLGNVLIETDIISEETLLDVLARQFNAPLIDIESHKIDQELINRLPEAMARRFRVIPISMQNNEYLVAFSDPTDILAKDEISRRLGGPIRVCVCKESSILAAIDNTYRKTQTIVSLAEQLEMQIGQVDDLDSDLEASSESLSQAPVIKFLSSVFEDAIQV